MKPSSSSPPRRKLTPKQRVLKRWPYAELDKDGWHATCGFFDFAVFKNEGSVAPLGTGDTAAAWADAARRL